MYNLLPAQKVDQNIDGPSTKSQNKPTAVKQEQDILVQDNGVQLPSRIGFTPIIPRPTLQDSSQIQFSQEILFFPTQRKRNSTRRTKKLREIVERIGSLSNRISRLERTQQRINMAKRTRRRNSQLNKPFHCHIANCPRKYQSQTALKQHMKIKHMNEAIEQEKQQKE